MALSLAYLETNLSEPLEYVSPVLTLSVSSKPTLANAQEMAISRESELNALLRANDVTVPLTNEEDISVIKLPLVKVVAADIWVAAYFADDIPAQYERYFDEWTAFLKMLPKLEFVSGAVPDTSLIGTSVLHLPTRRATFD